MDVGAAGAVLGVSDPSSPFPLYPPDGGAKVADLFAQLRHDHASVFRRPWTGWIGRPLSAIGVVDGCLTPGVWLTATAVGQGQRLTGPAPPGAPMGGEWIIVTDAGRIVRGLARDGLPLKGQAWGYALLPADGPALTFVLRHGKLCQIGDLNSPSPASPSPVSR